MFHRLITTYLPEEKSREKKENFQKNQSKFKIFFQKVRLQRSSYFSVHWLFRNLSPTVILFVHFTAKLSLPIYIYIPLCQASNSIKLTGSDKMASDLQFLPLTQVFFLLILISISRFLEIRIYRMSIKSFRIVELIGDFGLEV